MELTADRIAPCIRFAALLMLCLSLVACGVKSDVQPPRPHVPAAPGSPALRQIGSSLVVSWTLPKTHADGSPLTDLQGFDIYKLRYPQGSDCPECSGTETLLRNIDLDYMPGASRRGNRLSFRDHEVEPGYGYRYRIVPVSNDGTEGTGAQIRSDLMALPPAPENLQAELKGKAITLSWSAVTADENLGELLGYNIYRHEQDGPAAQAPLNADYWVATSFTDTQAENGKTYVYTLRSVWRNKNAVMESNNSAVASVTPEED